MGIINEMVGDGESSSKPEPKGGFGSWVCGNAEKSSLFYKSIKFEEFRTS